jgi:hypothetical protein
MIKTKHNLKLVLRYITLKNLQSFILKGKKEEWTKKRNKKRERIAASTKLHVNRVRFSVFFRFQGFWDENMVVVVN